MYKEKIGSREYFAEVITKSPFDKSFLKLWWNKDGEEISLELYPGGGLEYIVDGFIESEKLDGTYKQLVSSLSDEIEGIGKTGIGAWKNGLIRFSYWANEDGIFFSDDNSDAPVEKYSIAELLERLNGMPPVDIKSINVDISEDIIVKIVKVMDAHDKNPCPFRTKSGACFADGERCNHYRKFVLYGWTCPRYNTDTELKNKLFDKV